ncbi:MAG: carbohydrate porin [Verrucomicrobiota bacterium]
MKANTHTLIARASGLAKTALAIAFLSAPALAGTSAETSKASAAPLSDWWNGKYATGNWFGVRDTLAAHGLTVTGSAREIYFGQVAGGLPNQPQSNWINEEKIKFIYDFKPVFGISGLTIESSWRYRGGTSPQWVAGTPGMFNPSEATSGMGVRILPQMIEYTTPNKMFTINAGWENPYDLFLQQPLSKMFENNSIASAKGIGGTPGPGIAVVNKSSSVSATGVPTKGSVSFYKTSPVPWSSSYASWGGTLKIRPTKETYIQSGLYLAISGTGGVSDTQYSATNVYPYTSVPQSYAGRFKQSGQVVGVVDGNGRLISGARQNVGWVPGSTNNHGLNFAGSPKFNPNTGNIGKRPSTPSNVAYVNSKGQKVSAPAYYAASPYNQGSGGNYNQNGLYNVNEIGWTPKFGKDKLEGKYVIGGYIWGQKNTSYTPTAFTSSTFSATYKKTSGTSSTTYPGNYTAPTYTSYAATKQAAYHENQVTWGLYVQADQMLYRVKEHVEAPAPDGKSLTSKVVTAPAKLSDKGLYFFSEATFTPPQNNQLPFYFQLGLVYKGLIPHRDNDSVGVAMSMGIYSSYYNNYIDSQNKQLQNPYGSAYNANVYNGPAVKQPVNPGTGTNATPSPGSTAVVYQNYYAYQPLFTSTEVIEAFYNVQINKWAAIKPYAQLIINPAGNNSVDNDLILGVSAKVTF